MSMLDFNNLLSSNVPLRLLLGTGVSRAISNQSAATWSGWLQAGLAYADTDMAAELQKSLVNSATADSMINVAEKLKEHLAQKNSYNSWMQETIGALQPQYPSIAEAIRKLMQLGCTVLTTNYFFIYSNRILMLAKPKL